MGPRQRGQCDRDRLRGTWGRPLCRRRNSKHGNVIGVGADRALKSSWKHGGVARPRPQAGLSGQWPGPEEQERCKTASLGATAGVTSFKKEPLCGRGPGPRLLACMGSAALQPVPVGHDDLVAELAGPRLARFLGRPVLTLLLFGFLHLHDPEHLPSVENLGARGSGVLARCSVLPRSFATPLGSTGAPRTGPLTVQLPILHPGDRFPISGNEGLTSSTNTGAVIRGAPACGTRRLGEGPPACTSQ